MKYAIHVCESRGHWRYFGQPTLCGDEKGPWATDPRDIECSTCKTKFAQSQYELKRRMRK